MDERCTALVWKRDTYRRTGHGPSGFTLHYAECRCSRAAKVADLCTQHAQREGRGWAQLRMRGFEPRTERGVPV